MTVVNPIIVHTVVNDRRDRCELMQPVICGSLILLHSVSRKQFVKMNDWNKFRCRSDFELRSRSIWERLAREEASDDETKMQFPKKPHG